MGNWLVPILNCFELIACLTGLYFLKRLKPAYYTHFVFYLAYIVIAEQIGNFLLFQNQVLAQSFWYNFFVIPIEFNFFYYLFHAAYQKRKRDWLPIFCSSLYLACLLADAVYFRHRWTHYLFYYFSYTVGNLLLLVLILRFFLKLINSDEILTFKSNQLFWISLGLLAFYLVSFPYYATVYNFLTKENSIFFQYYRYFTDLLNILMYLLFAISFLCRPQADS